MNAPIAVERKRLSWLQIWLYAVLIPTQAHYRSIIAHPKCTTRIGLFWLAVSQLVAWNLVYYFKSGSEFLKYNQCVFLLSCVVILAISYAWIVLNHKVALNFDAKGSLSELVFLWSAIATPLIVVGALLSILPYGNWLTRAVSLYALVLYVMAIRVVYGLPLKKALLSFIISVLLGVLIIALISIPIYAVATIIRMQ
jgi:hypothetical protein